MKRVRRHRTVLGILIGTIFLVHLPILPLFFFAGLGNWLYPCFFVSFCLMASVPFILMKIAPRAAGFHTQWFPKTWSQWACAPLLILLLFVTGVLAAKLTVCLNLGSHRPYFVPSFTSFSRLTIATNGILYVLLGPLAEEIFWRGYVLAQLRKLSHWAVALPVHALLFALPHFILSVTLVSPFSAFFYALVLGVWRIRFRSLLPLILSHIVVNAIGTAPILNHDYQTLRLEEEVGLGPDFHASFTSNPRCREIASLTRSPPRAIAP